MEDKLLAAASKLPETRKDFASVRKQTQTLRKPTRNLGKRRLVILAAVLCLLVTACAYSSTQYGLWGGYHSNSFSDAKRMAAKFDLVLPESMNGSPFDSVSTAYGAPHGYTHLQALLSPTYKLYSVSYRTGKQEIREDGSTYELSENTVNISFGTTEKEQWKYHFSVAEDGSCNYHGVEPGSNRALNHEGYTLYLYTIGESHSVRWEDSKRNMVIDVTCYDLEKQEDAIAIAEELIDLNQTDMKETQPPNLSS